jgi:hypothetical protein
MTDKGNPYENEGLVWGGIGTKGLAPTRKTRGVSDHALAIYIKKYLKAKQELWKLKYFTLHKNILIFKKIL